MLAIEGRCPKPARAYCAQPLKFDGGTVTTCTRCGDKYQIDDTGLVKIY
jgi:hypothetical protein